MATTMKLIAKTSLGSDASSIEFTSIPGTYTDLLLMTSLRSDRADVADVVKLQFNSNTSNYSARSILGTGSSALSTTYSGSEAGYSTAGSNTANTFSNDEFYIPNYAGSTNKSFSVTSVTETNNATAYMHALAGLWSNTAAITSLKLTVLYGTNFKSGSSAFLYGITKA